MSSIGIGILSAIPPNVAQVSATARTGPAQVTPPPAAAPEEDTVKLSVGAQVASLHESGQSPASIASALGTNVTTVDSYLGIVPTVAVPTTAQAAPAAHVSVKA
jgi:hypothetical protein